MTALYTPPDQPLILNTDGRLSNFALQYVAGPIVKWCSITSRVVVLEEKLRVTDT